MKYNTQVSQFNYKKFKCIKIIVLKRYSDIVSVCLLKISSHIVAKQGLLNEKMSVIYCLIVYTPMKILVLFKCFNK